ncbi:MAG: DUF1570 domain-containing protein [Pirellulales bacterium]|nr:DUF1570 domain-containing protein [Pirellulales bacterium]
MDSRGAVLAKAIGAMAVVIAVGCAQPIRPRLALPEQHSIVRDQLVVHSDFPLPPHHRLLEELTARRVDLSQQLLLPVSDEPIHVFVFQRADELDAFVRLRHPSLPRRRAFFLETDTQLRVYAQWGDRVAEDLRHEVTHGYLHSVVPCLPIWLDEGLAEYYEVPRGRGGLNSTHVEALAARLAKGDWRPDLSRLEALPQETDMTQDDYAESWAWAHFLLATRPARQEMLRDYLRELRLRGSAPPLSLTLRRAGGSPEAELMDHIRRLTGQSR